MESLLAVDRRSAAMQVRGVHEIGTAADLIVVCNVDTTRTLIIQVNPRMRGNVS